MTCFRSLDLPLQPKGNVQDEQGREHPDAEYHSNCPALFVGGFKRECANDDAQWDKGGGASP
jgi:hypothetical protein